MNYQNIPFDKRIKENIRNYTLSYLYDMGIIKRYFENLAKTLDIHILLTGRHGEKEVVIGDSFLGFYPDVVNEPGRKIRVQNRTIAHLYVEKPSEGRDTALIDGLLDSSAALLSRLGEEAYLRHERGIYLEELEERLSERAKLGNYDESIDALTGVLNQVYFENKMKEIDESAMVPVGVVNVNINDWKFVNDHFGDDESDRLIQTVAHILKEEAGQSYIIGRVDGDAFGILIPYGEEGEGESYAGRIQDRCLNYEDPVLAPSVAVGVVYKTNIEERLSDRMSDAEYEMFNNKFEIKHAPGYRERLEKGYRS